MSADSQNPNHVIYKIVSASEWDAALATGRYTGSADDLRDGYIHLSNGAQLEGTARKYFAGRPDLVLVAFRPGDLGAALRWEPSRGGALFPHYYGALDPAKAIWRGTLTLDPDGIPLVAEARRAAGEDA